MLDKGLANLVAGRQELGQIAGAGELHAFAVTRQVRAAGIDRPAFLLLPQPARRRRIAPGQNPGD